MLLVRRLIETPACRRFVQIDIRDFMLGERELAAKYGVPWHSPDVARGLAVVAAGVVLAGLCLVAAFTTKGA
jgi:hypothetical protein